MNKNLDDLVDKTSFAYIPHSRFEFTDNDLSIIMVISKKLLVKIVVYDDEFTNVNTSHIVYRISDVSGLELTEPKPPSKNAKQRETSNGLKYRVTIKVNDRIMHLFTEHKETAMSFMNDMIFAMHRETE